MKYAQDVSEIHNRGGRVYRKPDDSRDTAGNR